jgi:hypothetical protein
MNRPWCQGETPADVDSPLGRDEVRRGLSVVLASKSAGRRSGLAPIAVRRTLVLCRRLSTPKGQMTEKVSRPSLEAGKRKQVTVPLADLKGSYS